MPEIQCSQDGGCRVCPFVRRDDFVSPKVGDLPDFARNAGTAIRVDLTHFEDDLSRQYRQIVGLLLAEAFYSKSDIELGEETRRAFYRYFDLSNEQLFLARQNHRVSDAVIEQWKDGIAGNMKLPAFKLAWREIGARKA